MSALPPLHRANHRQLLDTNASYAAMQSHLLNMECAMHELAWLYRKRSPFVSEAGLKFLIRKLYQVSLR